MSSSLQEVFPTQAEAIALAHEASVSWLVREQTPEGFWVGVVETNSSIEAEWLLASHILGTELPIARGLIKTLFDRQRPDGSWDIYPGARKAAGWLLSRGFMIGYNMYRHYFPVLALARARKA